MIPFKKQLFQNTFFCLTALALAWGLKAHYSTAHAANLTWILAPTAGLVATLTGHPFYFDPDVGYINPDLGIIIAPACAGVNFLITAFCMGFFCGFFRVSGFKTKFAWLVGCAALAFIATLGANALRIGISIAMITSDFHAGWLTPQRVHRMGGILIYFFFLSLFYLIICRIIHWMVDRKADKTLFARKPEKAEIRRLKFHPLGIWPLACYWTFAIGVPALNDAYRKDPAGFAEHSLTVAFLSLLVYAGLSAVNYFTKQQVKCHETQNPDHRRRTGHCGHHPVRP